jgi:hypothetical protein
MSRPARKAAVSGEKGHALNNQVGVNKILAISISRQKLTREGRLSDAVRSRDDVSIGAHERRE